MCDHFLLLLFLVLLVCVFLCISVCIYLFLPCLVSWGKHHECVSKLWPECCSGCRERQSERHIRRYAVKTLVTACNKKEKNHKTLCCRKMVEFYASSSMWFQQEADVRFLLIATSSWASEKRPWSRRRFFSLFSSPLPQRYECSSCVSEEAHRIISSLNISQCLTEKIIRRK